MFDHLANTPVILANPTVVRGVGVTHLRYQCKPRRPPPYRWLFEGPTRLRGLDTGCCSIGSWSRCVGPSRR